MTQKAFIRTSSNHNLFKLNYNGEKSIFKSLIHKNNGNSIDTKYKLKLKVINPHIER